MVLGIVGKLVVGMRIDSELTAAAATPLVLGVLSEGEGHGYSIIKRVREVAGGELEWADALMYPLFHRLYRLGYLEVEWRDGPHGRRRRYYAITDAGRAALARRRRFWATSVMGAVNGMWRAHAWLSTSSADRHRFPAGTDRPAGGGLSSVVAMAARVRYLASDGPAGLGQRCIEMDL